MWHFIKQKNDFMNGGISNEELVISVEGHVVFQ